MPKRTDLKSVLVIGSGPIVIGQAAEFDYSGTQALRVLKEEGLRVILVNSNPATIMTDPEFADATYIEPITPEVVEKIIAKERPDAILPTLGGQTALNTAIALDKNGVLEKYNVELIGANIAAIELGEDREKFKGVVERCGAESARSHIIHTIDEALAAAEDLGYPMVVRPSFTMGGLGSGLAYDENDLRRIVGQGLQYSPTSRGAARREHPRLEGIRARDDARQERQRRGRLLHRELRPGRRAHRRLDHRRPGPDPDGPRVPAAARHLHRRHPRSRRRHRRLQHPVRRRARHGTRRRDRDEPARLPLLRPGLQGHRLRDRQDRHQALPRLHPGRDPERHHPEDPGVLRADPGLRRREGPALRLREVPGGGPHPDHHHEVGGRGHGHGPQLHRGPAEGAALPRAEGLAAGLQPRPGMGSRGADREVQAAHHGPPAPGPAGPARRRHRGAALRGHQDRPLVPGPAPAAERDLRRDPQGRRPDPGDAAPAPSATASPTSRSAP